MQRKHIIRGHLWEYRSASLSGVKKVASLKNVVALPYRSLYLILNNKIINIEE